jgi:hypothetical protein
MADMGNEWRFPLQNLFGLVGLIAVALGLTRFLLSLLRNPTEPSVAGFLFLEVVIAVACWAMAIGELLGQKAGKSRWSNFALAVVASLIVLFSFALLLPA